MIDVEVAAGRAAALAREARRVASGRGRKPGPKPPVKHEPRAHFPSAHPCLVTLKVRQGVASLRNRAVVRKIEKTFRQGAERGEFRLVHYSVQSDHLHALVEADGPQALGRGTKSLAARFALAGWRRLGLLDPAEVPA